jgi:probable HAF family extracellular repeat protein
MVGLGDLPGGVINSQAYDVSDDGSVIVGFGTAAFGREAFRWTATTGMIGLGDFDGGEFNSQANAVSGNGAVVVGTTEGATVGEGFRWSEATGMLSLGQRLTPFATSFDGSIIVGGGFPSADGSDGAFIWDSSHGVRRLRDVLITEYGLGPSLAGWKLGTALAISADGNTIVGEGTNAFLPQGWIVVIPEPPCALLVLCAAPMIAFWLYRRELTSRSSREG